MPDAEALANLAKEFSSTEYGQWLITELERRIESHSDLAEGSDAHNLTVNHTMRAAGLREGLKLITDGARMADSPIFKKK